MPIVGEELGVPADASVFSIAMQRDRGRCVYCDLDILRSFDAFASSHLDHIKPRSAGGVDDDPWNRAIACGVCNSLKGSWDPCPDQTVTSSNFGSCLAAARAYVREKRTGQLETSYFRDYEHWVSKLRRGRASNDPLYATMLRIANLMKALRDQDIGIDTRLLLDPLVPDHVVTVGRSSPGANEREHVIPRLVIANECERMLKEGASVEAIASFLKDNLKIVMLTPEERRWLDRADGANLRQRMPVGWRWQDGDPYARLREAKIAFTIDPEYSESATKDSSQSAKSSEQG